VHHRAHLRLVGLRTMDAAINREKMARGKLVSPLNHYWPASSRLDRRTGGSLPKSPHPSWPEVAMNLAFRLPHHEAVIGNFGNRVDRIDAVACGPGDSGNWQLIDKWLQ